MGNPHTFPFPKVICLKLFLDRLPRCTDAKGISNSQSYGGNVFSECGLSTRNTFLPCDWLLPNLLGICAAWFRSKNNLRQITFGKGPSLPPLFSLDRGYYTVAKRYEFNV